MLADRKRILQLIASKPGLRTVEVAETVDCEMDMVEIYIREELKNGIVIVEKVQVPGGREVNSYTMRADCVPLYLPKKAEEIPDQPVKRRGNLAVEFLRKNGGRANRDQLLIAMGLTRTNRPDQWLIEEMRAGLIRKDGGDFVLTTEEERIEQKTNAFSCALWSDGEFVMMRKGQKIVHLTAQEKEILFAYVLRMSGANRVHISGNSNILEK